MSVYEYYVLGLERWAEGEEGDWVASVSSVAAGAVVNVDVPGWGVALDAVCACHPAERPDRQPVGVGVPGETGSVWMNVLVWFGRWDKVSLVRTGLINGRLWLVMVCGIGGLCMRRVGVRCEAHFANVSASSLPCMPIWERIHCVLCGKGGMRWVSIWYQRSGLYGLL